MGYRPCGGVLGVLGAVLLVIFTAWCSLANDGTVNGEVGWALLACGVVVVVFVPLAVSGCRRQP